MSIRTKTTEEKGAAEPRHRDGKDDWSLQKIMGHLLCCQASDRNFGVCIDWEKGELAVDQMSGTPGSHICV